MTVGYAFNLDDTGNEGTSMISVVDMAWVRYAAPDLDLMEDFLKDFGLRRVLRTPDALYMRGDGIDPVVHVTERGPARSIGFALKAASADDLAALARSQNVPVESRDEPGGGQVVRLADPEGFSVEVVHDLATETPEQIRPPFPFNPSSGRGRFNDSVRSRAQPSRILRLGHVAVHTSHYAPMRAFYCELLGLRVSDSYHVGSESNAIASFLHCGLDKTFVDHHTIALIGDGRSGFEHSAFEVLDFDDLMTGQAYLSGRKKWQHSWGVGRHVEGSQIFDYWRDPFGQKIEHWTDGDLVNDDYPGSSVEFDPATCLSQWGPPVTPDFLD